MRGDRGGALRWAGLVGLLVGFTVGAVILVAILSRAVRPDVEPVAIRLPADIAATTTTIPAAPPTKATNESVPAAEAPPTSAASGDPLAAVFITGPGSAPSGEIATYCVTGAPSPVITAAATLDGVVVGPVGADGCLTVMVEAGPHELRVVAFGAGGSSVTSHMSITGMG